MDTKNDDTHIQKIVPMPPYYIANAIPAREPAPIFEANDIINVSFELIPVSFLLFFKEEKIFMSLI